MKKIKNLNSMIVRGYIIKKFFAYSQNKANNKEKLKFQVFIIHLLALSTFIYLFYVLVMGLTIDLAIGRIELIDEEITIDLSKLFQ